MTTKNQLQVTQENLDFYHKLLEDLLESIRHGDVDQLRQLVEAVRQTPKNPQQEIQTDYAAILKVVYTILGEYEDAEGSDTMSDIAQGMHCQVLMRQRHWQGKQKEERAQRTYENSEFS